MILECNEYFTPIILFVYNRPIHTKKTLNALSKNHGIINTVLYVYADGLKLNASRQDMNNFKIVKKMIREISWAKEINIIERSENWGLANNIVDGVTSVIDKHKKVIVLEDDIITSPGFLTFMNKALRLYENDKKVMSISGYMYPINTSIFKSSTFFYNLGSCWGWATYKRSWDHFIHEPQEIWDYLEENELFNKFNFGGFASFSRQLYQNITGQKKTWAVKWYGTIFLHGGLALNPINSFTFNIGNDNSGENSPNSNLYNTTLVESIDIVKETIVEYEDIYFELRKFYFFSKPLKHTLIKVLNPILPTSFKKMPFIK